MRTRTALIGGVVAVGLVAGGLLIGRASSDDSTPRELLIVPRPVERRDLDDVLTISGEIRRDEIQTINLPVDGKVSSLTVEDGDTIEEGDSLFALDGRTSVAVVGDFAFYRRLDVGSEGPDVHQLESILVAAGYPISSVDTLYTEETRQALTAWQADHGYGGATPEPVETITVGLSPNQAGYTIGKANTVAYSIVPSEALGGERLAHGPVAPQGTPQKPIITLGADLTEVVEGGQVVFTFVASPAPANNITVDLTIGGDATGGTDPDDGADYQQITNSFLFPAGQTSYSVSVPVFLDQVKEGDEEIVVSLTDQFGNDPNYVVGPANQARVTILANGDDLVPVITVTSNSSVVREGGAVTFTFRTTVESNQPLDLVIALGGSAANGTDYVEVQQDDVTIAAGQTPATLQVQTRDDDRVEGDERIVVSVVPNPDDAPGSPSYVVGNPASAAVTIQSDDLPELTLRGGGDIREGGAASFTIVADAPVAEDTSVNYQVGGTAQPGSDYDTLAGTVILPAGHSQVTVVISTIDDDVIFLPSDMVVADWPARIGTVDVDEGEFVLQGAPVLTLTEPVFTITLSVSASDRAELKVGQKAEVHLDSADSDFAGIIATLDETATVDQSGAETYEGTVQVEGDLVAVDGARVTIDVTLAERLGVLAVPVAAVLRSAGGDQVRVINDEGTISRVDVTIGLIDGEWVEIVDGLRGDELVVVDVDPEADPGG